MPFSARHGVVAVAVGGLLGGCGAENPSDSEGSGGSSGIEIPTATEPDGSSTQPDDEPTATSLPTTTFDPDDPTDDECGEVMVTLEPEIPTLVLLVDQSGSMTSDFGDQDRWDSVYQTLMDPDDGVVAKLESQVRFGLTLYTSEDGNDGGECPRLTSVAAALDNRAAIDAAYAPANPVDETPTGESLAIVAEQLAALDLEGPKAIVLATDGMPDTCEVPNPQEGQPESLAAAAAAFEQDISTFVISVGDEVGAEHLQEMANVGVGKLPDDPMPAPYYEALNPDQLVDAFSEIVGSFISCDLTIEGEVDLEQACEGEVLLDGQVLECGTDWEVIDEMTLRLLGTACDTLQDGSPHSVEATWPCDAIVLPG